MTFKVQSELRQVKDIEPTQMKLIKAFMQGAIYSWVKNNGNSPFAVRDLVGGENTYWEGTPLISLFKKHEAIGKNNDDANEDAGKDIGWIVKSLLDEDKREFERIEGYVNSYKCVGEIKI